MHHVDAAVDEVDGGASRRGLGVDRGARFDEVAHVGDVHPHLEAATGQRPCVQCVIDVDAAWWVDGADLLRVRVRGG